MNNCIHQIESRDGYIFQNWTFESINCNLIDALWSCFSEEEDNGIFSIYPSISSTRIFYEAKSHVVSWKSGAVSSADLIH